jgi:uncharacterized membrane protein
VRRVVLWYGAYLLVLGGLAAYRWHIWTYGTDTGTFAQVIANAFGGFNDGPEQGTHFRFHWAPIVALLWPLVTLTRSPLSLQLAQTALIGATIFPLYALARGYLDEREAGRVAFLALLYPPLAAVGFTEFHEIAFYPVLALGMLWAADRTRWVTFALCACGAAFVREDVCLVNCVAGIGLTIVGWSQRNAPVPRGLLDGAARQPRKLALAGLGLTALNAGSLAVFYGIVIPHVGAWQPSRFYDYSFAQGPLAVLAALSLHPKYVFELANVGRATYLLEALVPLAFLPLLSRWGAFALPGLVIILLSSDPITWRMGSHYPALWIPWFLIAALAALVSMRRRRAARAKRWTTVALALCVVFLVAFNPMHVGHYLKSIYPRDDARRALALVPPGALLVTHDEWFTQVALRFPEATVFFCPYTTYAAYADDFPNDYFQRQIHPELEREVADGSARIVAQFGQVKLYKRTPAPWSHVGNCVTPGDVRYKSLRETTLREP